MRLIVVDDDRLVVDSLKIILGAQPQIEVVGTGANGDDAVALCAEHLGWKPTTTYTVIKRLSERGVLKNENTVVTSLISQDEAQTAEIDELLDKRFDGSLPAFVAAFTKSSHVSDKELDEVQKMIDLYRKENHHG